VRAAVKSLGAGMVGLGGHFQQSYLGAAALVNWIDRPVAGVESVQVLTDPMRGIDRER